MAKGFLVPKNDSKISCAFRWYVYAPDVSGVGTSHDNKGKEIRERKIFIFKFVKTIYMYIYNVVVVLRNTLITSIFVRNTIPQSLVSILIVNCSFLWVT